MRKFAAFDIDGTISRSSLFSQVVDELINTDKLPIAYRAKLDEKYDIYQKRSYKNAFKDYTQLSVDILINNLTKVSVDDYRAAVDRVVPKNAEYFYVYTKNLIISLKKQGYFLIALSGSEMYSVQKFTESFEFDLSIGEYYHENDGYFTGKIDQVVHKKDIFLKKLIEEHDLTLKGSYAIGDSSGDIGMLEMVENPIAFNPEDTLFEKAKKEKWKIVVERKNVIYELEASNGSFILA